MVIPFSTMLDYSLKKILYLRMHDTAGNKHNVLFTKNKSSEINLNHDKLALLSFWKWVIRGMTRHISTW